MLRFVQMFGLSLGVCSAVWGGDSTFQYYLPKTTILVDFEVTRYSEKPGRLSDLTDLFFPTNVSNAISTGMDSDFASRVIRSEDNRYSLKVRSIGALGVRDPARLVKVQSKATFSDLETSIQNDEFGLPTAIGFSKRNRAWDFLLGLITRTANFTNYVRGGTPTAGVIRAQGVALPDDKSDAFKALLDEAKKAAERDNPEKMGDDKPCPYAQEFNSAESATYKTRNESLREFLHAPFCQVPPDFRGMIKQLSDSDGVGIYAFQRYFEEELKPANPSSGSTVENPFRPSDGSKRSKLAKFFEAWRMVRDLEALRAVVGSQEDQTMALAKDAGVYRLVLAERSRRIEEIGTAFFGSIEQEVTWMGRVAVTFSDRQTNSAALFSFDSKAMTRDKTVLQPSSSCKINNDVNTKVIWLNGEPGVCADCLCNKQVVSIDFSPYLNGNDSAGDSCDGLSNLKNELAFLDPALNAVTVSVGGKMEARKMMLMSQGGQCRREAIPGNGRFQFRLDPVHGGLISFSDAKAATLNSDLLEKIQGALESGVRAKQSFAPKPGPSELQLLETDVRKKLLEACRDNPLNADCIAYLKQ